MIFESLVESDSKGELILVDGGMLRFHLRRDGVATIREILVTRDRRGCGVGRAMLRELLARSNPAAVGAKCPADLESNRWYESNGFALVGSESSKGGRKINHWRLALS